MILYYQIQNAKNDVTNASNKIGKASLVFAVIYLLNIADAYFFGAPSTVNLENPDTRRKGISTNAFQSFSERGRENTFLLQYIWEF